MTLTPQPPSLARNRRRVTGLLAVSAGAAVLGACLVSCGNSQPQAAIGAAPAAAQHQSHHQGHVAGGGVTQPAATVKLPRASMKKLKTSAGCPKARLQIDADELKQAACQTKQGRYTIVTFTTDKGKRDWLDYAQPYGGTYLVGDRWTVVSEPALLEGLRKKVGGQIETGAQHH
ncbi:hypothetical protein ABZW11_24275 [Nonomuraea sp. NPDC004580]|uniref:hypothetical protein n=1 Tax=Nonomuraea sp. NPDC004580 TaxID=3154552 RepID=UPI0033B4A038